MFSTSSENSYTALRYPSAADAFASFGIDPSNPACAAFLLKEAAQPGVEEKGMFKLYTDVEMPLIPVLYAMEEAGFTVDKQGLTELSAEFERIPNDYKEVTPEQREQIEKLLEKFEDDDDVQNVFHNMKEDDTDEE